VSFEMREKRDLVLIMRSLALMESTFRFCPPSPQPLSLYLGT